MYQKEAINSIFLEEEKNWRPKKNNNKKEPVEKMMNLGLCLSIVCVVKKGTPSTWGR